MAKREEHELHFYTLGEVAQVWKEWTAAATSDGAGGGNNNTQRQGFYHNKEENVPREAI